MDLLKMVAEFVAAVKAKDWWLAAKLGMQLALAIMGALKPQAASVATPIPGDLDAQVSLLESYMPKAGDAAGVQAIPWALVLNVVLAILKKVLDELVA